MEARQPQICECGNHAWVPISRGYATLCDPALIGILSAWRWSAQIGHRTVWARRNAHVRANGVRKTVSVSLHSVVMPSLRGFVIDHINGNGLDNRAANLRLATPEQNALNRRPRLGKSHYKGVTPQKRQWRALITVGGEQMFLGRFKTEVDAARAYDAAAQKFHGEFARLNFPQEARI